MDYKRVLRLHFVNHLSGREIAESCGDAALDCISLASERIQSSRILYRQMSRTNTLRAFFIKSLVYQ